MKNLLLLFCFVALGANVKGQPLGGSSNVEQLQYAVDSALVTYNWFAALENLEKIEEIDDQDSTLAPNIALMNLKLRDVASAVRGYKSTFRRREMTDTTFNVHRFYYGQALKMDKQYDEARTFLEAYLQNDPDGEMAAMARLELEGIELYKDLPEETSAVAMELLGRNVNSSWSEYSPVLSGDGEQLYFSTVKATEAVVLGDANNDDTYLRLFSSTKNGKGEWGKPEALAKEVNRPGVHSANPAISADGRRLIFNRLYLESNVPTEAKIYFSDEDDTGWKAANPVSGINGDYLALQPAVGELYGREVLFFVSDMDGGFGGLDIYYANYEGEGRYGTPVNLGETINTAYDDITPFYFDGTLYFSTNGRPTMGGYDLFYAAWNGSNWSEPENMGAGINSSVDDQSLSVFGDGLLGFMTSNREGGRSVKSKTCCDDVYGFQIAALYANLVVGLFNEDKEPLTTGTIELQPLVNDSPDGPGEQKTQNDGNRFDFGLTLETQYQVTANHPGYYPDSVELSTLGLEESKEFQQVFFLKKDPNWIDPNAPEPEVVPVYDTISVEESVVLENILYDLDKANIRPDAEGDLTVLKNLLDQYPEMVIELGSHTDPQGGDDYNQQLSQRRAVSARKWLIIKGDIAGPRIKIKGYGETVPVVVSERLASRVDFLNPGDVLTEEFILALPTKPQRDRAYELNRRTEFKVLEGPENLIIRRDVIERKLDGPQRNALPVAPAPASPPQTTTSTPAAKDTISRFSTLYGQENTDGLPYFKVANRTLNLGPVKKGDSRSFSYTFTNVSEVPAQVMLIQACSCTTTEHDNSIVYGPGESGVIEVVFDSTEKDEDETITIDIYLEQTDAAGRPILEMVEYSFELIK